MQPVIYSVIGKNVRLAVTLILLLLPACILFVPRISHAQNVPEVGKPEMVGTFCPACKAYIDLPNHKMPSSCPYCGYSFIHPAGSPATEKFNNAAANSRAMEAIGNAYSNTLNSVKTDSATLAQEYKRFNELVATQETGFDKERKALFSIHTSTTTPVSLPLVREKSIIFTPPQRKSFGPLADLSDEELTNRYASDAAEIHSLQQAAKRTMEDNAKLQNARTGNDGDIGEAGANLKEDAKDDGIGALFVLGEVATVQKDLWQGAAAPYRKYAKNGVSIADKGYSLGSDYKDLSDSIPAVISGVKPSPAFGADLPQSTWSPGSESCKLTLDQKDVNSLKLNEISNVDLATPNPGSIPRITDEEMRQAEKGLEETMKRHQFTIGPASPEYSTDADPTAAAIAVTDAGITLTPAPDKFAANAGAYLWGGKVAIHAIDAYGRYSVFEGVMEQEDDYVDFNSDYTNWRTKRIKVLEADQANIRAEQARRAALRNEQ